MSIHWLQHLLHCQVKNFMYFPDYKVLSVNMCSKEKKQKTQKKPKLLKVNFVYQTADFLHTSSISFFSDYSIFSFIISQPVLIGKMLQVLDHLQSQHYKAVTSVKEA